MNRDAILDWLLEEDNPPVRFLTLTRLLHGSETDARVQEARAKGALKEMGRRMDYTEYGGAPLLGVAGVAIVAHGRSNARAIKNAIRLAQRSVENDLIAAIQEAIASSAADS